MSSYFDQSLAQLKSFEGCVPWMYRDTVGKVTVGVGLMLPDAAAACALPFQTSALTGGGAAACAATKQQIAAEFARVEALAMGKLPSFYRAAGSLELPELVIDEKLSGVLTGFEATLRARLAGYDALPDGVKMALLDMAYNLGPEGLLKGYPKMIHAVETGAWAEAAAECARGGINAARNAWTRQQMLSAVVGAIKAEAETVEKEAAGRLRRVWRGVKRAFGIGKPSCCP
jgi:GH24 family phage-related lysozyme (muramidase)